MALTWSTVSTPNTGAETINDMLCVGADKFVAVGTNGTVLTSSDGGATWVSRVAAASSDWSGLAFDGTTVVAVGYTGATRVMVSTDFGETWTGKTAAQANNWASVTYAAFLGMFVAVSNSGVSRVMTSVDSGDTWAAQSASSASTWAGVAASGSLLLAWDGGTNAMTSSNGTAWSAAGAAPANIQQVTVAGGSNTVVYSSGAGAFAIGGFDPALVQAKFATTVDGSSWSYVTAAPFPSYGWINGLLATDALGGFLGALPVDNTGTPTPTIIGQSVDDGTTWTPEDTTFSGSWLRGAWDDTSGVVVFWDNDQTNTMLRGESDAPVLTDVTPSRGTTRGGTVCTLTGTGLDGISSVTFGGTAATDVVPAADGLSATCIAPAHVVGTVNVEVA